MEQGVEGTDTRRARLIVAVVCAAVFVETLQFTILSPVLPVLARTFELNDVSAGFISSSYALGLVLFQLPAGRIAARIDERVGVGGALLVIGAANVWFAMAGSAEQLSLSRFIAGAASAMVWAGGLAWVSSTGPRTTQGTRLAAVISAAILGSIVGPALGTLVTVAGRDVVFVGIAVVCCFLTLPIWLLGETHSSVQRSDRGLLQLARTAWLTLLVCFFIGTFFSALGVMVPLEAVSLGAPATVVGFAFIMGSVGQAALAPLVGRLTDSKGAMRVMAAALSSAAILTVGLVVAPGALGPVAVLAVLIPLGGAVYTPTTVSVDDVAHRMQLEPAIAFSAWNFTWAVGVAIGSVAGPAVAGFTGNSAVYVVLAVLAAGLGFVCWRGRLRDSPSTT